MLTQSGIYVTTVPKPAIFKEQFFNLFRKKQAKIVIVKSKSRDLQWLADKLNEQKIVPVLDKTFELADMREAQAYIASKRATGKVVIALPGD